MTMTKKDYELIANSIKESIEFYGRDNDSQSQDELARARTAVIFSARQLANALEKENSKFNKQLFFLSCGLNVRGWIQS